MIHPIAFSSHPPLRGKDYGYPHVKPGRLRLGEGSGACPWPQSWHAVGPGFEFMFTELQSLGDAREIPEPVA